MQPYDSREVMESGSRLAVCCQRENRVYVCTMQSQTIQPRLMTAKQTAVFMGLSHRSIYHRAARGQLPYVRVGGRIMFDRLALERWIDRNSVDEFT